MSTKRFKPITPSLRTRQVLDYSDLTTQKPEKSLLVSFSNRAGRSRVGKITVRHRGGGVKRAYRLVDFKRTQDQVDATVKTIEYDPFRSANIALLHYANGVKSYILAVNGMKVGDRVRSGVEADIVIGNTLPLSHIPVGSIVHNVELSVGGGAKMARSAGASVTVLAKNNDYATLRLPSGEVRLVNVKCRATLGQVGNLDFRNRILGKAGATRWVRRRPQVRGAVMNPCDHPHGGGEGKSPVGRSGPMTPWGKKALGLKTRDSKKNSSRRILKRRK
jgi:large subunit ribosomal protein L2